MIQELALYEKLTHQVTGTAADLAQHLFGSLVYAEALVVEHQAQLIGFALFFQNLLDFFDPARPAPRRYLHPAVPIALKVIGTELLRGCSENRH